MPNNDTEKRKREPTVPEPYNPKHPVVTEITCPKCARNVKVGSSFGYGSKFKCTSCGRSFIVTSVKLVKYFNCEEIDPEAMTC